MIGTDMIYSALILITLLMIILSVPSIFLSLWTASKQLKKYITLRKFKGMDGTQVPPHLLEEWNTVRTDVGYAALITEEIEKMGTLRAPLFQSELAIVLIIVMAFFPGYETPVLIFMMTLLAICVAAIIYSNRVTKRYGMVYIGLIREMSAKAEESDDVMYG